MDIKRERERNWSQEEKDIFRELIAKHVSVIDDKRNDSKIILKKKFAWQNIKSEMEAVGYNREIQKLKQQWMRMKAHAKNKLAAVRKARSATGNNVTIPKMDETEEDIINMIQLEVFEDTTLIDSNSEPKKLLDHQEVESGEQCDQSKQSIENPSVEAQNYEPHLNIRNQQQGQVFMSKLQKLPKRNEKYSVLEERMRQIKLETKLNEEKHTAEMESIRAEMAHKNNLHILEVQQLKELHELKKKILVEQFINFNAKASEVKF